MARRKRSNGNGDHSNWMVTYASLLTAVLAFFLLFINRAENEAAATFKFPERLKSSLYGQIMQIRDQKKLNWLYVEDTGTKGIKLLIPSKIGRFPMFKSESDQLQPLFEPYLSQVVQIINSLGLEELKTTYAPIINRLQRAGKTINVEVTIEGHTDRLPLRSSKFTSNWELSLARSYEVLHYFQTHTRLPLNYYSLAGYGPFHPLRDVKNLDENRRVEIYINIQMVDLTGGTHV
ncbi:MAG: OmpA family protein [FCB group bacterium]|nr:OmpA family protein [FCB group bacterium]